MPRIVTITFSPCIDKSASVERLIPEKKLRCSIPKLEPGGGGINVARAIKKLGGEATAIYPSGGYIGKFFDKLLFEEGIPTVIIPAENETRENIIILEKSTNLQYRFGMPGMELKENEWNKILLALEEIDDVEFIVASGSLQSGVPATIFARIAMIAKQKKAKLIVDTSGKALKQAVEQGVYLLKPNLGELSYLLGKEYLQLNEIPGAAMQLIESGKCEIVVVSMAEEGALLVTKDFIEKIIPPPLKKKSTVGAGDSMVAGIVWALSNGKNIEQAARYGVASGAAATMNAGTELCKRQDVEKLYTELLIQNVVLEIAVNDEEI